MDPNTHITEARFTFLDIETTGLSYVKGEDIIELACVRTEGLKIASSWSELIDAKRDGQRVRIKDDAAKVHGIHEIDLAGKPEFKAIAPKLVAELRQSDFVVIHNAPFDAGFIVPKMKSLAQPIPATPTICSLKLARNLIEGDGGRSLDALRFRYVEDQEGQAHRALNDTLALYSVFFKLIYEFLGEDATLAEVLKRHGPTTPFLNFTPR